MSSLVLNRWEDIETRFTNLGDNTFELNDYIVNTSYDGFGVSDKDVLNFLGDISGDVTIRINSKGGDVGPALGIFNRLNNYEGGTVTTINDGYAWSSAGWIGLAGDVRIVNSGALFMMHNPMMHASINKLDDFEQLKNQWETHLKSIVDIFTSTTNMDEDTAKNLMAKETFMSADEAIENGIYTQKGESKADFAKMSNAVYNMVPDKYRVQIPSPEGEVEHVEISSEVQNLMDRALRARKYAAK